MEDVGQGMHIKYIFRVMILLQYYLGSTNNIMQNMSDAMLLSTCMHTFHFQAYEISYILLVYLICCMLLHVSLHVYMSESTPLLRSFFFSGSIRVLLKERARTAYSHMNTHAVIQRSTCMYYSCTCRFR